MDTPQTAAAAKRSLAQDWLSAVRYWLGGRRGLFALAAVIGLAAVALNWGWLVAVGIAPLLLASAPCAAMCALGLCMNRMGGSCSSKKGPADDVAVQAAQPGALPARAPDANQLKLGLDGTAATPGPVAASLEATAEGQHRTEERTHA